MTFDRAALDHVARLARLSLSESEAARLARELADILARFESLPDSGDVAEREAVPGALREDVAVPAPTEVRARILAAFPRREGDRAKVPRGL